MKVLVLNAGSSSVKHVVIDPETGEVLPAADSKPIDATPPSGEQQSLEGTSSTPRRR